MLKRPRMFFIVAWLVLYGIALFTPAMIFHNFESTDPPDVWKGWEALLLGWLGLFYGQPGWVANLFMLIILPLCCFKKWKWCAILAGIGLVLAAYSFTAAGMVVPRDEGCVQHCRIGMMGPSFYFWLASFGIWLAALPLQRYLPAASAGIKPNETLQDN